MRGEGAFYGFRLTHLFYIVLNSVKSLKYVPPLRVYPPKKKTLFSNDRLCAPDLGAGESFYGTFGDGLTFFHSFVAE